MSLASINVSGRSVQFLRFLTEEGFQSEQQEINEEELNTPGVDGRRFRTVFRQFETTTAETTQDCATYNDAKALKKLYQSFRGRNCILQVTAGGVVNVYPRVHISGVKALAHAGKVSGAGASSSSAAYVDATWSLVVMEAAS
jgi:hypothetical protein